MPALDEIPTVPYLSGPCQRFSNVGAHGAIARVRGRIGMGLGLRGLLGRLAGKRAAAPAPGLGEPSRFREGDLVRVLDEPAIRATLDTRSKTRGLEFGRQQWPTCGKAYRVTKVVRRIIDDGGTYRRVSRTVLLEGVHCDALGPSTGCGRECPMMYRDEWLEPAPENTVPTAPPHAAPDVAARERRARVRSAEEIRRTLDPLGRRGSLLFMPEMARLAGQEIIVTPRLERVFENGIWIDVHEDVLLSRGHVCTGAILGAAGPCERECLLLWHRDWLEFS